MPQASINPNSKPKKKKGHKPAHQNTFAFKHNPKSKLTAQILSSPNIGVCQRCHDKIEWRKKYRKYKPLTQPSTCNLCSKRNVLAAYHTICCECSLSSRALEKVQSELMELSIEKKEEKENASEVLEENIAKESIIDDSQDNSVVGTIVETSNHFMKNAINHDQACSACVKDFALADDDQGTSKKDKAVNEQISEKEKELGRPLKLREQKAIERKVQKLIDQEKAKRREERRRANGFSREDDEVVAPEEDEYSSGQDDEISDDSESIDQVEVEEDPFLLAVGGKDKLLTGEAYQRMLLEKERSTKIS
jgi:hypothetical protein